MFNTITKFYNMLGEIVGIHTIKKKKCNKIYDGYMADDEKSDDFDINYKYKKSKGGDGDYGSEGRGKGSGGDGSGGDGDGDNTVMVDGLEQILLKVLKL